VIDYYYGDEDYIDFLIDKLNPQIKGMKICMDCANGATALLAPMLFSKLGAKVTALKTNTGGDDINKGCGATEPEYLLNEMKNNNYDIGFCYDGDGDRLMCVQEDKIFDGDHLMYAHAKVMKENSRLKNNTIVGTIMSNIGTEKACEKHNINFVRTPVGDKHVHREMKKSSYNIGGEESGHIIFTDYMSTGDGILASLLTAMLVKNHSLKSLDDIEEYPKAVDCYMCDKETVKKYKEDKEIKKYLDELVFEGRLVVRPSGTEPKIRILVEAKSKEIADKKANEIKEFLKGRLD
ncbi:MAG: phosphoglucosamine mutase, partial [Bacillota bacterium]